MFLWCVLSGVCWKMGWRFLVCITQWTWTSIWTLHTGISLWTPYDSARWCETVTPTINFSQTWACFKKVLLFFLLFFFFTLSTYQCPMTPKLATVQIWPNYLFNTEANARVSLMFFLSLLTFRSSALCSSILGQFTRRQTAGLIPLRPFQPRTDEARLHWPWTELL